MWISLFIVFLLSASTPEEFLHELCDNQMGTDGAIFWSTHASAEVPDRYANPDSLLLFLADKEELSVNPGSRTNFLSIGETFRIEFGKSYWTWIDQEGSRHRTEGLAVIECTRGNYTWVQIPVLSSRSVSAGKKQKLISGILITILILVFTAISVGWAKRRYLS
ncbi:MAG: hypothetical protein K8R76_06800 [Candidatus Aegiribacteria sp.]|nr:hypothetical protein [Candidatus Aegiribacteria sp.]